VRNVLATNLVGPDYKTEPYIEVGAENYCYNCWQPNICGFRKRGEQYLFLFTTCRCQGSKHLGKVYVVGYIERDRFGLNSDGGWAVIGPTKLYAFKDAYPLGRIRDSTEQPRRMGRMLTSKEVSLLLRHFKGKKNILEDCRNEVRRLKRVIELPPSVRREQEKRAKACRLCS